MLIFIKVLVVGKQQKQFKDLAGIFFLQAEFFGALLCILASATPVCWRIKGRKVTFNSGLKERDKLE